MRAPPNGLTVVADGKCGPITQNAIWWFQSETQRMGVNIYPDGVVDKASDYKAATSATHMIYSMLWLNLALMRAIGETRFKNLENESICPYPLKIRLAVSDI